MGIIKVISWQTDYLPEITNKEFMARRTAENYVSALTMDGSLHQLVSQPSLFLQLEAR